MTHAHAFNTHLAASQADVDQLNRTFYGRFAFPWPPMTFEALPDDDGRGFGNRMVQQDIGVYDHRRLPLRPRIWVAGCGTNQAVYTALRFPEAEVLGTDLSSRSLATCRASAEQLGITNLRLEEMSINEAPFEGHYDLVICTGVIHHNADPAVPLARLARALAPDGVLELMVYNYYHRFLTTAYQKAIRLLCRGEDGTGAGSFEEEMALTRRLVDRFPTDGAMAHFLAVSRGAHEAEVADRLLQPVEYSYTVESLDALARGADLEILQPCLNHFDKAEGRLCWNMPFDDPEVAARYNALADVHRWQITNLLLVNDSPMLWFYLQRADSPHPRQTEGEICAAFLRTRFAPHTCQRTIFRRDREGRYRRLPRTVAFPTPAVPTDDTARRVFDAVTPEAPIAEAFRRQGIDLDPAVVNRVRLYLTTSQFPYLRAQPPGEG